mmetsp:Transcript_21390/g.47393  ORF Transcript_21390/g.47393 Transcript_21390/m.47393 type:complete len:768 (+) Transcript_21390:174-2477(+)
MIPLSALGGSGANAGGSGPPSSRGPGMTSGMTGMGLGLGMGMSDSVSGSNNSGNMIPLGALGGGSLSHSTGPASGMGIPGMSPPSGLPPSMEPPMSQPPPSFMSDVTNLPSTGAPPTAFKPGEAEETALAEVGKTAKDYLDVLMPISIPAGEEDSRPVPKQVACLENGTDLFKMFDVDMHRFDPKAVRKAYHKMALFVHPEKLGREPSVADKARFTKLKQSYTVVMDEQLRGVYRQHCFGISGSGGCPAQGHEVALSKALELGRELRKMGEERAIVLHKAAETGWSVQQKDQDGRKMRGDGRKNAHQFNLFGEISSEEDDNQILEKERRMMSIIQILEMSPKYADVFLERARVLLLEPNISSPAAGGAFTMKEEPQLLALLNDSPKTVQRHLRRLRTSIKQMNWAMTSLLQHKDSPWRGLEVKGSLVEHGTVKLLEIVKSGIAFGKFSEVHEVDFSKLVDNVHRLYMDVFERRGQELLRAAIQAERTVVYLLPESEGRLPDGTRIVLKELKARPDLNGKAGIITGWDYTLRRYNVELERQEAKKDTSDAPANPDLLNLGDVSDAEEEEEKEGLAIPKKLVLMPKNAQVDMEPARKKLEELVKSWNAWRQRPRSVSATQDAEAVAAALGPPLESMAGYLRDACSAVQTAASCPDGADLVADECRESLQGARNLAAKLLGEEPQEPPPPPSLTEPPPTLVALESGDKVSQTLKEAAEVAAAGIEIKQAVKRKSRSRGKKRKSRSRSRSRRRRRRRSSSSSSSSRRPRKK